LRGPNPGVLIMSLLWDWVQVVPNPFAWTQPWCFDNVVVMGLGSGGFKSIREYFDSVGILWGLSGSKFICVDPTPFDSVLIIIVSQGLDLTASSFPNPFAWTQSSVSLSRGGGSKSPFIVCFVVPWGLASWVQGSSRPDPL
jgi:hypothetical protein